MSLGSYHHPAPWSAFGLARQMAARIKENDHLEKCEQCSAPMTEEDFLAARAFWFCDRCRARVRASIVTTVDWQETGF